MQRQLAQTNESRILTLLAADAFLVGLSFGLLYNAGYTLLVYRFGAGGLRLAYVAAGIMLPAVSLWLQKLESRLSVFRLSATLRMVLAGITPLVYLFTLPVAGPISRYAPYLVMLLYTMGALYSMMLRGSIAAEFFDSRTLKKIYPRLTAWEMVAIVVAGLAVTPLSALLGSVEAVLPVSAAVLIVSMATGRKIRHEAPPGGASSPVESPHEQHSAIAAMKTLTSNRYAMLVFVYQFLAFSTSLVVQYLVYAQARSVFGTQAELTQFVGLTKSLVTVVAMAFTFLAAGSLLLRFGMLAGLGVGPALVLAGVMGSIIAGAIGVPSSVFLGLLVLVQIFEYGSYSGFAKTAVQSAFQPLSPHDREAVHGFAQGIGIPMSYGFSGLLLILLNRIDTGGGYTAAVTVVLTLVYGAAAVLLFRGYGTQLRSSLSLRRIDGVDLVFTDASTREVLHRLLETADRRQVAAALDLMFESELPDFESYLHELIDSQDPGVRAEVFLRAERLKVAWIGPIARAAVEGSEPLEVRTAAVGAWCAVSGDPVADVAPLLSAKQPEIRSAAVTGLFLYGGINGILEAGSVFKTMAASANPIDRWHAAEILARLAVRSFYHPLVPLLRDENLEVRRAALRAAGSVAHRLLLDDVIALTGPAETRADAITALTGMGDSLQPVLVDIVEDRTVSPPPAHIRIVRAAGRIDNPQIVRILVDGVRRPPGEISSAILQALVSRGYRVTIDERPSVLEAIEVRLSRAAMAVMALHDLDSAREIEKRALVSAIHDIYLHNVEDCFLLLSLLHSAEDVQGARRRMLEGSQRDRALAAELLDVILTGPMRQRMLAVAEHRDDRPPEIEQYRELFGLRPIGVRRRIGEIIANESVWTGDWVRVCAQTFAWRIGLSNVKPEDNVLTTIERVIALKTADIFSGIPDSVLAHIASIMEEVDVPARQTFINKGEIGSCMYTIRDGRVSIHDGGRTFAELGPGEVVGEMAVLDPQPRSASVTALEETVLLRLDKENFDSVMADHPVLAQGVIAVLCRRLRSGIQKG